MKGSQKILIQGLPSIIASTLLNIAELTHLHPVLQV
jgi:hypothetical protein